MKLAVLIDSTILSAWQYKILDDIRESGFIEIDLITIKKPLIHKLSDNLKSINNLLFYAYEKLDYLLFKNTVSFKETPDEKDALEKLELDNHKFNFINFDALNTSEKFDLFLDFTSIADKNFYRSIFKHSRQGICLFEFGCPKKSYNSPAFFWDLFDNKPVSGAFLKVIDGKHEKTLYESYSCTNNISHYLNQNSKLWKVSDFIIRALRNLEDTNRLQVSSEILFLSKYSKLKNKHRIPTNIETIQLAFKLLKRIIARKHEGLNFKKQWFLAYRDKNNANEVNIIDKEKPVFKVITPPEDRFFADPFVISENNKSYVFFEDYFYTKGKGLISYFEISEDGIFSPPEIVLEREYHLSYPFVFKHKGKYYMIPETLENKTIELYESVEFPKRWQLKKVLFENINAVDTTLFEYNEKFWLFTNISKSGGSLSDELFLFYSDSPFGKWTPHPKNPVISNVKFARSAGKLFFHKNELIRPSQETSIRYGYALNFNKVETLTEEEYKEVLIKTIKPEFISNNLAIHTFNSNDKYEIIDGMRLIKK